jgi:MOSC domain-containing protein YiiM
VAIKVFDAHFLEPAGGLGFNGVEPEVTGAGDLGENILTAGLDLEGLPLGTILKLGAKAAIELTGLRTPCALIDRFKPGLKRRMLVEERCRPRFRCGVMGVVRSSGRILIGDAIAVRFPARPLKSLPAL